MKGWTFMKKFVIAMVFIFLTATLISVNYLLWDREQQMANYKNMSASKNLSIEALEEKNYSLSTKNQEYEQTIKKLTDESVKLNEKLADLSAELDSVKRTDVDKNLIISRLKGYIDTAPMQATIEKWVQQINKKSYSTAFTYFSVNAKDSLLSNSQNFKNYYQKEVKSITVKSVNIITSEYDMDKLGKLRLLVNLDIERADEATDNGFVDGPNQKIFTMEYDEGTQSWVILEISDK